MRHTNLIKGSLPFVTLLLLTASCHTPYHLTSIDRTRILIDNRYDAHPDAAAADFIKPYEHTVDSLMKPVVGSTAEPMIAHQPESNLSNLLADILVWGGEEFNEKPDFGVYNMGGIRASLPQGDITYGDVLNVAPFENHICFLTLSGEDASALPGDGSARRRGRKPQRADDHHKRRHTEVGDGQWCSR